MGRKGGFLWGYVFISSASNADDVLIYPERFRDKSKIIFSVISHRGVGPYGPEAISRAQPRWRDLRDASTGGEN